MEKRKKKKPTGKRYDIDSFEKLINVVNRDNYEAITMDFIMWVGYCVNLFDQHREKYPKESEGKTNWQIARCHFIWIDDGKNKANQVVIQNDNTGEIVTVKIKE